MLSHVREVPLSKIDMSHHPIRSLVSPAHIALSPRLRALAKELVEALCHAKKQRNDIDPASSRGLGTHA